MLLKLIPPSFYQYFRPMKLFDCCSRISGTDYFDTSDSTAETIGETVDAFHASAGEGFAEP